MSSGKQATRRAARVAALGAPTPRKHRGPMVRAVVEKNAPGHHPLVKWFEQEMLTQNAADPSFTLTYVARRAGYCSPAFINYWRSGGVPNIANFDAVLAVLGYRLAVVPLSEVEA